MVVKKQDVPRLTGTTLTYFNQYRKTPSLLFKGKINSIDR